MKPGSSNRGFGFIPADTPKSQLLNPLWYRGSPSPLSLSPPFLLLQVLNSNAVWLVSEKSPSAPLLLYKCPRCFQMCRSRKRLFLRDAGGVAEQGRGGFIFVFQEEVNNKYSLTCRQHNICSVALRRRSQSSGPRRGSMRPGCISWAVKCGRFLYSYKFSEANSVTAAIIWE